MRIYSFESRNKDKKIKIKKSKGRIGKWDMRRIGLWAFRLAAIGVFLIAVLFLYYSKYLPDPGKLVTRQVAESTKIYARDNSLLYEIHGEVKRTLVKYEDISDYLKNATVAIEDKDFYKHHGISFSGIARSVFRAAVRLDTTGGGGSTITQQLVKNAILNNKKSIFGRKVPEAILSIELETKFKKEEILQMYLNEIPYGKNTYGAEAASQSYFGKHAKDLSLAESAYLASLPQAPSRYNPFGPNRALLDGRKDYVLSQMKEQGYINEEQEKQAKAEKVAFSQINTGLTAPHFVFMVEDYLAQKFGEKTLQEGGLKVYTTLDPKLQKIAEDAVNKYADVNAKKYNGNNEALVAIDPKTGQILAMVGSKNYFGKSEPEGCVGSKCTFDPQVNVAISPRQPGSSFKPYVYVTAFSKENKYSPSTMLMDVVTNFGKFNNKDYIPTNYDGSEHGPVSIRQGLAGSLNIPAVKTLALVGVEKATETAHKLGITSPLNNCGLSLVLGGCEVKLVDHVAAYSALANGGVKNEQTFILKIVDKTGQTEEEFQTHPQEILDPQAVYELISIMTDNNARAFVFGPNSPLILPDRKVAAKTGTTNKWHDGWTLGFTPSLAAGVWVGNNNGDYLKKNADGVIVAAPIWHEFMLNALKGTPAEEFTRPNGIREVDVDTISGKLPTQLTPTTKKEVFADYSVPTEYDNVHQAVSIDTLTGLPATPLTPPNQISYRTYVVLHSERPQNSNWEDPVVNWAIKNGYGYPSGLSSSSTPITSGDPPAISINQPDDGFTALSLPLHIEAAATGPNPIARVDVSVDGVFLQSLTTSPYSLDINKDYGKGPHTIAVKAVDVTGKTADTSVQVNFDINGGLQVPTATPTP